MCLLLLGQEPGKLPPHKGVVLAGLSLPLWHVGVELCELDNSKIRKAELWGTGASPSGKALLPALAGVGATSVAGTNGAGAACSGCSLPPRCLQLAGGGHAGLARCCWSGSTGLCRQDPLLTGSCGDTGCRVVGGLGGREQGGSELSGLQGSALLLARRERLGVTGAGLYTATASTILPLLRTGLCQGGCPCAMCLCRSAAVSPLAQHAGTQVTQHHRAGTVENRAPLSLGSPLRRGVGKPQWDFTPPPAS